MRKNHQDTDNDPTACDLHIDCYKNYMPHCNTCVHVDNCCQDTYFDISLKTASKILLIKYMEKHMFLQNFYF